MSDFIFRIVPNIVLGSYTVSRLAQYARGFGSRFMVVMDPILKEAGVQDKILQPLTERKVEYFLYDELNDGANTKDAERALALAREGHIHGVIAAGGGKAMNTATAVAALYNENHSIYDYADGAVPTTAALPLVCIPTTIRVPFAFTPAVPLIDSRSQQIRLLKIQGNVCKLVLMDPNLTMSLTENQSASMAIETLAIAAEAYLSQKATFFSDMLAEKAAELLGYGLDGAKSLEITTPAEILTAEAGCLASLAAASSSVGTASLIALAVNARYRISRSLVSAILLPYMIEDAGKFKTDRIERLARAMNVIGGDVHKEDAVQAFAENVRYRLAKANLPVRLKELSVTVEQLALAAEDAGQLDIMNTLPRGMTSDDLFEFIKIAY